MAKIGAKQTEPRAAQRARPRQSARGGMAAAIKVVLVGFMGAGKSTIGRRLAELLERSFVDSDSLLEERLGEPIASIFERDGEQAFREHERALVLEVLERPEPGVVSLGGGAVESEAVRTALASHLAVHAAVDPETAWTRSAHSGRPLAQDRGSFLRLYERRLGLYESVAPIRIAWADVGDGHPVLVGPGAIGAAGTLWPRAEDRAFVIEDELAGKLHGKALRASISDAVEIVGSIRVPPGERSKSLGEAERVLRALAAAGVQRADTVVALGGGVTGDLAGFCAATYQRGVAWVQVPTTVVGQVDSAYGGKTSVDLPEGKNYVGAFHQPAAVFADPRTLATLPAEELGAGYAEILKTALIAGGGLWEDVRALPPLGGAIHSGLEAVARVLFGCVTTKLEIVSADARETGVRASLNLGHTFAHALESATSYQRYRHGEAVALGLLVALRLSEREFGLDPGVRTEVRELLAREGLPTTFAGPETATVMEHVARDKKRRGERRNLVLLRMPGDIAIGVEVDSLAFEQAIDEIRGDRGGVPS
jgi:shikimate kinase / 3-dehydroquinate synthase